LGEKEWVVARVPSTSTNEMARYDSYYKRFSKIFKLDPAIPRYFVPGNHDTG
jgi:hypothetical protein